MSVRTRDAIQLLVSLIAIPVGCFWTLGRVAGYALPKVSVVPMPVAVLVLLGGLGGAFFSVYRLADADKKPQWQWIAAAVPLGVLALSCTIWFAVVR